LRLGPRKRKEERRKKEEGKKFPQAGREEVPKTVVYSHRRLVRKNRSVGGGGVTGGQRLRSPRFRRKKKRGGRKKKFPATWRKKTILFPACPFSGQGGKAGVRGEKKAVRRPWFPGRKKRKRDSPGNAGQPGGVPDNGPRIRKTGVKTGSEKKKQQTARTRFPQQKRERKRREKISNISLTKQRNSPSPYEPVGSREGIGEGGPRGRKKAGEGPSFPLLVCWKKREKGRIIDMVPVQRCHRPLSRATVNREKGEP